MAALYVDAVGGAAGDMILAALLDLGAPLPAVREALASLPLPAGCFDLRVDSITIGGVHACRVTVAVRADPAPQRTLADVVALLAAGRLSPRARDRAELVFRRLAAAEARVHAVGIDAVHFHEVGAVDAVVDIVGTAIALDLLDVDAVRFGLLGPGTGVVTSAHGPLPLPAPATLELLTGIPIRLGGPPGEWVTPTAAAILTALGAPAAAELAFRVERVGVGAGHRSHPERPNVLRAMIGEIEQDSASRVDAGSEVVTCDEVVVLEAAIDDQLPTALALAAERLWAAGALDVLLQPAAMKRGRPGTAVTVLARPGTAESLARTLLRETSTLGLRLRREERRTLRRRIIPVSTPYGPVRMKETTRPGTDAGAPFLDAAPETADVARAAVTHGVPFAVVAAAARSAWAAMSPEPGGVRPVPAEPGSGSDAAPGPGAEPPSPPGP